jgi:hypothetical protein
MPRFAEGNFEKNLKIISSLAGTSSQMGECAH